MAELTWKADAPLVIAHRGASAHAPENTMAAFRLAAQMGADGIEFDVKLTADGVPIVMHDATLDRTTSGSGEVSRHTLAEIRKLDAGAHFGHEYAGEKVPTLAEVLEGLGHRLLLNIELTNYRSPLDDLPARCLELVEEADMRDRVLFSSFNPLALWRLRGRARVEQLGMLVGAGTPAIVRWLLRIAIPHGAYHPQDGMVTRELIAAIHRRGRRVHVWTVNDQERMRQLLSWGADGLITDRPDLASALIKTQRT